MDHRRYLEREVTAEGEEARYLSGLNQHQKGFTINEGMCLYMIKVCECNILKG